MNAFPSHFMEKKKQLEKDFHSSHEHIYPFTSLPSLLFLWISFTIITPKTNPYPTYILFSISFLYLKTLFYKCSQQRVELNQKVFFIGLFS